MFRGGYGEAFGAANILVRVHWQLSYALALRDLEEMAAERDTSRSLTASNRMDSAIEPFMPARSTCIMDRTCKARLCIRSHQITPTNGRAGGGGVILHPVARRPFMSDQSSVTVQPRRREFMAGAATLASAMMAGLVPAKAFAAASTPRAFGPVRQIAAGPLDIGYVEVGPSSGPAVLLFHGWPYDIHAFAEVAPLLAAQGYRVIVPHLRGYGTTTFRSAETPRNAQQAALAADGIALMDALGIRQAIVAGFDWGARTADIMAVLWPQRCKALVSVSGYLIGSQAANAKPLPPKAELQWWYQFYFATERGQQGYSQNTHDFAKLIWRQASPGWKFSDSAFEKSARALDNPDHVAVTISNYRWRLGIDKGEQKYAAYEQKLAQLPAISVPTITIEGDNNGAPHPAAASYRAKFSGRYQHRDFTGNIGHNPPQEDPTHFVQAVVDADRL